jgi:hypothetical protein
MEYYSIDFDEYASILNPLVTALDQNNSVYADSVDAFEDWMADGMTMQQHDDWLKPSVTIWIQDMPTWRFDVQINSWREYEPGRTSYRIFRILSTGVMGEITPQSATTSEEWFPVSSPHEAFAYIDFLINFSKKCLPHGTAQQLPASSLIKDTFVPFYRFPDDLSLEKLQSSWISTRFLKPLIDSHIKSNLKWMEAPLLKLRKTALEKNLRQKSADSTMTLSGEIITHADFVRYLAETEANRYGGMAAECAEYAGKVSPKDILNSNLLHQCVDGAIVYAQDTFGIFHERLNFNLLLNDNCFGPFFRKDVNPAGHTAVSSEGVRPFLSDQSAVCKQMVDVPKLAVQKRIAFEAMSYRQRIARISEQLGEFRNLDDSVPAYADLARRRIARYHILQRIKEALPSDEQEIARVTHPIPYFIEQPLIHWERATPGNRFLVGSACLSQILKTTSLVGLEELHAVWSSIESLPAFPDGLLESLCGKPSLGHWSRCVDHLAKLNHHFSVWNAWIQSINSERELIIQLIELRNQISHPDFLLDPDILSTSEEIFTQLFNRLLPKLRSAIADVEVLLPCHRTVRQMDDGETRHRIRCKNLKSASQPFAEVDFETSPRIHPQVIDEQLFSARGDHRVPLAHFFKALVTKSGKTEIYIYDKEYTGKQARMTEVGSGISAQLSVSEGIFIFG